MKGRLDRPPEGTCADPSCRNRATKWIGTITETRVGTIRQAVGVCDRHFGEFTSDAERTLGGCSDASIAASRLTGDEPSAGRVST